MSIVNLTQTLEQEVESCTTGSFRRQNRPEGAMQWLNRLVVIQDDSVARLNSHLRQHR